MRTNRTQLIAGLTAAFGLLVTLMSASPASAQAYGTRIKNNHSSWCLEIGGWRTDNGAPADQWGCTGGDNQVWVIERTAEPGLARIVNGHSGKCLEVADWRKDNGAPVRQWDCTGGLNQRWIVPTSDSITYAPNEIRNANSGLCLEIGGWSTAWGTAANQWQCHGGASQKWNYFHFV
ncbi:RICIN domain-containing protein [Streptomyces sp. NPDC058052]|uniref:RICIN domain-containing protein n=1 Tax=Streptomyces sp. NPDC058052 TaxID=3346316 RepID=UPI0036E468C5